MCWDKKETLLSCTGYLCSYNFELYFELVCTIRHCVCAKYVHTCIGQVLLDIFKVGSIHSLFSSFFFTASTCPVSHQSSNLFSVHVPEFGMQLNASRLNSPVLVTLDNIPTNCNLHLGNVTLATNCSDKISVSLLQESLEINYNSLPALTRVVEDDDGDHAGSFVQVTFRMPEKNYALKSSVHLIIRIKKDNEGSGTSRTGASSPCAIWSDYNSHARSFTRNCSGQSKEQPSHYCIDALTRTPRPFLIYHFKG